MEFEIQAGRVYELNHESDCRIVINRGGTRSGKSYALAQLACLFLVTGYVMPSVTLATGVWSIVRRTLPALKASVLRDFEEILHNWGIHSEIEVNRTDLTFRYQGRTVEFFSLDDSQKVRSRKRDVLNISEANEVAYEYFQQLIFRTAHRVYLDFNPDDDQVWIKTELEDKRAHEQKDVGVIVSTYLDNPFLLPSIRREIEILRDNDTEAWQVFGLGCYGKITGLIYPDTNIVPSIPTEAKKIGVGMDFGFSNDETAAVEVWQLHGELWLNELIYERGLTNPAIAKRLIELGQTASDFIVADSAEPKSIAEINGCGLNVRPATKGADSIRAGIGIVQRYRLNVTSRSVNLLRELRMYKWATDRDGKPTNTPSGVADHCLDGLRYICAARLSQGGNARVHTSLHRYNTTPYFN